MADFGQVALGDVRAQAQQRADMLNSQFLSVPEWNALISSSYKELYDLLITSYGEQYFVAPYYNFTASGLAQTYALPDGATTTDTISGLPATAFYKLLGVDLSAGGTWITLRRFELIDRNKILPGSNYNVLGYTNLRYKIMGNQLWFNLPPSNGSQMRLIYIPKPQNLQPVVTCTTTLGSATVVCADTSQLVVGQSVYDYAVAQGATSYLAAGSTITAISANTSFTVSTVATATGTLRAAAWSDTYLFDGVSGWEEYIILCAAYKAITKEGTDLSALAQAKGEMLERIVAAAPSRDAGQAATVSDTAHLDDGDLSILGYRGMW